MTNLSLNLTESAAMYPEATAIRCDGSGVTFAEFDDAAARLAAFLEGEGLRPGDRVAIMLPNVPAFAVLYYGVLRMGGIAVPLNPLSPSREVGLVLDDSGAVALFAAPAYAEVALQPASRSGAHVRVVEDASLAELIGSGARQRHPVSRSEDDTALIAYTFGPTGAVRGVELTHGNLDRSQAIAARHLLHAGPDDVVLGCVPLFDVFGMTYALNASVSSGSTLTLVPSFDARTALQVLEREDVTIFEGPPGMYAAMLTEAAAVRDAAASLRVCVSAGEAMPAQVLHGFEDTFGCTILEGYGPAEASSVACFNHPHEHHKTGSIGTLVNGVQMRVVDDDGNEVACNQVGEIQIRGHTVMKGYWRQPQSTAAALSNGWLTTGDLGRVDEDGYYYLVGRHNELISRGGHHVFPSEVEKVLYEHPAVAEAAVVGIAHLSLGGEIGAAVALKPGAQATADDLQTFVKDRLAAHKYPRRVWLVDELPKGPTGRLLRRSIEAPPDEPR